MVSFTNYVSIIGFVLPSNMKLSTLCMDYLLILIELQ